MISLCAFVGLLYSINISECLNMENMKFWVVSWSISRIKKSHTSSRTVHLLTQTREFNTGIVSCFHFWLWLC